MKLEELKESSIKTKVRKLKKDEAENSKGDMVIKVIGSKNLTANVTSKKLKGDEYLLDTVIPQILKRYGLEDNKVVQDKRKSIPTFTVKDSQKPILVVVDL